MRKMSQGKLKIERVKVGMTQQELSKLSGVSRNVISKVENGDLSSITYGKMEKLSKVLGLSPKELFFE